MSDPRDFAELVRRHQGAVCAVAFSVLRDRARSEEVAQDAFLIAWQKLPSLAEPPVLPAWICGIARNLARNAARRPKEPRMDSEPIATETPLDSVLDREADDIAARALAALAEADREVVVLYYRGDGSIADVAGALGISEPAARQRLHRGRERLKSAVAAVESSLRASRPGPAFTAGCVAALAAGLVPANADAATAAGTGAASGAPWLPTVLGVLLVAGIGIGIGVYVSRREPTAAPAAESSAPTETKRAEPTRPALAGSGSGTARAGRIVQRIDAPARASLAEAIATARRRMDVGTASAAPVKVYDFSGSALDDVRRPAPPPAGTPLAKSTIRYALLEIQPLLLECYTEAAPRLARRDGTLSVTMRLVGEPGIGTLVESVALDGDAHLLADATLSECLRETLASLELAPMTAAETWDVTYPFVVR